MLIAAHSIGGAIIGQYIDNPVLAFLLGIILHFLIDAIPHEFEKDEDRLDFRSYAMLFVDLIVAVLLWVFVLRPNWQIGNPILWGAFGGIFPDIFDNNPIKPIRVWFRENKFYKPISQFHEKIQAVKVGFWPGILVQIVSIIIFLFIYLSHR